MYRIKILLNDDDEFDIQYTFTHRAQFSFIFYNLLLCLLNIYIFSQAFTHKNPSDSLPTQWPYTSPRYGVPDRHTFNLNISTNGF